MDNTATKTVTTISGMRNEMTCDTSKFSQDLKLAAELKANAKAESENERPKLQPFVRLKYSQFLLVAKNGAEAKTYARENGLRASEWKYISTPERMTGATKCVIVAVPGWEQRPDAVDMRHMAMIVQHSCTLKGFEDAEG